MLTNLLFFAAISSGGALAAVLWKRPYEDILPITASGIICVQFLAGAAGSLEAGFLLTVAIAVILWGAAFFVLARKKDWKNVICSFFSYGFWLFLLWYIVLNLVLHGMLVHEWDEFSHWGTAVKAMVQTGAFGTAPQSHMLFGSYPPGMALFQYFMQKIYLATGNGGFSEWRLYLAYIVLGSSFLLPLIKRMGAKSFKSQLAIMLVFVLAPLSFYSNYYHSLYIDAFLGILSGAGYARIVVAQNKFDKCYFLYILSVCTLLVLAKSSGILLAVMVAAAFMADYKIQGGTGRKSFLLNMGLFTAAIGTPGLLWHFYVKASGISLSAPVAFNLQDLFTILLGKDETYRALSFKLFKTALFDNTATEGNTNFAIGNLGISISYFALLVIFAMVFYFLLRFHRKKDRKRANTLLITAVASAIGWLVFQMSLCIVYLFSFTESEALRLASYTRYSHTIYLGMYLLIISSVIYTVLSRYSGKTVFVVITGILLLLTPVDSFAKLLFRDSVQESIDSLEPYVTLSEKIGSLTRPDDNIYFICQDERFWFSGIAYWQISFAARPAVIDNLYDGWAMFEESTNIYNSDRSPAEWKQFLIDK